MYNGIKKKMADGKRYYLLLDEVQEIKGWERAVNSLLENANRDIYVTGSNSKLMSSEISTYLTGRYISIPVFTLSFAEYMEFKKASGRTPKELLTEYIRMGGFSIVALYVQVYRNLPEESDREVVNLLEIKDHYLKYVVTLDELAAGNINGVKIVDLADFLLAEDY